MADIRKVTLDYEKAIRNERHEEAALLANRNGILHHTSGQYADALKWFKIEEEVSTVHILQRPMLSTYYNMGVACFKLTDFHEAIRYQKKCLELAHNSNEDIERQKANAQLGLTYYELFSRSDKDYYAGRTSKKYFKLSMELARSLWEKSSFETNGFNLEKYVKTINNMGMIEMDLENWQFSKKLFLDGLELCDREQLHGYSDERSRLHLNLGLVYIHFREWKAAEEHTKKANLKPNFQSFQNLGELNYLLQKFDNALFFYQKAIDFATKQKNNNSLNQINQNIKVVSEASIQFVSLTEGEQKLEILMEATSLALHTENERKCLLDEALCLDNLIEIAEMIFAWPKHLEFSKKKKKVTSALRDMKKLSDSFLVIGKSYMELRKYRKAHKWFVKSLNTYNSCGDLEGQASVGLYIGFVFDYMNKWDNALKAYEEAYRLSVKGNLLSSQLCLLEYMHFTHLIRFDDVVEARKLHAKIQNLKLLKKHDSLGTLDQDHYSKTILEGNTSNFEAGADNLFEDNVPLSPLFQTNKKSFVRKRTRVVYSDEEDEEPNILLTPRLRICGNPMDDVASHQDMSLEVASKSTAYGSKHDVTPSESDSSWPVQFQIGGSSICVDLNCCLTENILDIDYLKVEVAYVFYLHLLEEKKPKGHVPVIHQLVCCGKVLSSQETIEDMKNLLSHNVCIEIVVTEWVQKDLMERYMNFCEKSTESHSHKLLKSLYNLKLCEDEIIVSDCALDDASILPFLDALKLQRAVALLDISHNSLGNKTMQKIQEMFSSSHQKYGDLSLDFHCNRFSASALLEICECSIFFNRLEVLNLSYNDLTDSCGAYLSIIVKCCKALYSLKIEHCSIKSSTITKLTEALPDESILKHLSIGYNNPISEDAMLDLLSKLSSLKRFSELSLVGIKLNNRVIKGLCQLAMSPRISAVFLGCTNLGNVGAIRLTNILSFAPKMFMKLDLSSCGITWDAFTKISENIVQINGIVELNLGGNCIGGKGCLALETLLSDPQCSLKYLILDRCQLGLDGIHRIMIALAGNECLEELRLAENCNIVEGKASEQHSNVEGLSIEKDNILGNLSVRISLTKTLQLLDLSYNDFSLEVTENLYSSWALARSRSGHVAYRHIKNDQFLHFCIVGRKCCSIRNCCKKD